MNYLLVLEGVLNTETKVMKKIGNWNSSFVNELNVSSWIFEEKNYVVILKCSKRTVEYYLSKIFTLFECNTINLAKLPNEVKYIIHAEETDNSDKVMTCTTTITSTSNTLKNLEVNKSFHYSYIQGELNDKKYMIINIFSEYVEPLLKYITI